jgi:hypothetical protein
MTELKNPFNYLKFPLIPNQFWPLRLETSESFSSPELLHHRLKLYIQRAVFITDLKSIFLHVIHFNLATGCQLNRMLISVPRRKRTKFCWQDGLCLSSTIHSIVGIS